MHIAPLNAGLVGFIFHCLLPYKREREERRKGIKEAANQFIAWAFLIAITFFPKSLWIMNKYLNKWNSKFEWYPHVLSYPAMMFVGGDNDLLLFINHYAIVLLACWVTNRFVIIRVSKFLLKLLNIPLFISRQIFLPDHVMKINHILVLKTTFTPLALISNWQTYAYSHPFVNASVLALKMWHPPSCHTAIIN